MNKLFVITRRPGRLGNRLLLFGNFVAYAAETGDRVMNFTFHTYAHLFAATRDDLYCEYPPRGKRSWIDAVPGVGAMIRKLRIFHHAGRAAGALNARVPMFGRRVATLGELPGRKTTLLDDPEVQAQIRDARIVLVTGWKLRAPKYVRKHADQVRAYFRPLPEFERAADEAIAPLRRDAPVLIGMHIRQTDYRTWKGGKHFFTVERYAAWMRELSQQFPGSKVSFLVCSDEPRNEKEFPGVTVGFGPDHPIADLCALSKCDYLVGPQSTFSQWASFYGNTPLHHVRDVNEKLDHTKFEVLFLDDL